MTVKAQIKLTYIKEDNLEEQLITIIQVIISMSKWENQSTWK